MDAKHTTLKDVPIGEPVRIRALLHGEETRIRLLEIGVMPGAGIRLVRRAPLGCPVEVDVAGARFSLSNDVLAAILVDATK